MLGNELINQIAVGAMKFDAVETSFFSIQCGRAIKTNQLFDFLGRQLDRLTWFSKCTSLRACFDKDFHCCGTDGGWRDGGTVIGLETGV
ncbi:hypothetical protein D3C87_1234920 [compost metagenome]